MQEVFAPPPDSPKTITLCGIAAKRLDIFVCPLQGRGDVEYSLIAGSGVLFAGKVSKEQISQKSQAVIVGHDHHIVFPGEVAAILVPRASDPMTKPPPWL